MKTRTIVIGCSTIALLAVAAAVVGGFLSYRHFTEKVPLPEPRLVLADDSVAVALLHVEEKNAWLEAILDHLAEESSGPRDPDAMGRITPLELIWTARSVPAGTEDHLLLMTLSPSGRIFGLSVDLALWKAGRKEGTLSRRVTHQGEGITSFPGAKLPGFFFARGPTIAWASGLEMAQRGVDQILAAEGAGAPVSEPPQLLSELFAASSSPTLRGALLNRDGSMARLLGLLPGEGAPAPVPEGITGLTFELTALPAGEAEGRIVLRSADPEIQALAAAALAGWLPGHAPAGVTIQAVPRIEATGATIDLKASGLQSLARTMAATAARWLRRLDEKSDQEDTPAESAQSSSTFQ